MPEALINKGFCDFCYNENTLATYVLQEYFFLFI